MISSLPYVVYSHTDYLTILTVQSDYMKIYENKILFINKNNIPNIIRLYFIIMNFHMRVEYWNVSLN